MRNKAILFPLIFGMLAVPAFGGHDGTPGGAGNSPAWDANLTYLGTFSGNDSAAQILADLGLVVTEIAKVDGNSGTDNGFTTTCDGPCPPSDSGTWSYSGSETAAYLVIKAGDNYAIYQINGGATSGFWETGDLPHGGLGNIDVSHITLYSGQTSVPEPASLLLLAGALLGIGFLRRKL